MEQKNIHHLQGFLLLLLLSSNNNLYSHLTQESPYHLMHLVLQLLDQDFEPEIQIKTRIQCSQMLSPVQSVGLSNTITYRKVGSPRIMPPGAMRTAPTKTETPILSVVPTTLQWICMLIVQATTLLTEVPCIFWRLESGEVTK